MAAPKVRVGCNSPEGKCHSEARAFCGLKNLLLTLLNDFGLLLSGAGQRPFAALRVTNSPPNWGAPVRVAVYSSRVRR